MIEISPRKISGKWNEGYALDFHTVSSDYIGDDEYGHPQFATTRTALGELLYRLKYGKDKSVIEAIVTTAADFVNSKAWPVELVVPVPPSRYRTFQPLIALAEELAVALNVLFCGGCVAKVKQIPELKDVFGFNERAKSLASAFQVDRLKVKGTHVLLFDDLYRSGATMNAVSSELRQPGEASSVYAMAITMTRRRK